MAVNAITVNTEPFVEFYRRSEPLIRRFFIEAVTIAARREAERYQLREMMRRQIEENELGIEAQLDPRQLNGFYYHVSMMDYATALTLLEDLANRAAGVTQGEEEEEIPMFITSEMVNLPPVKWLVEGFIPEDSFTLIAGEYGAGKSFVMIDVAFHVALGLDWHGRKVEQGGPVVYMAAEGGRGLQKRIEAWLVHHGFDIDDEPVPLHTIPKAVSITNPVMLEKLIKKIPQGTRMMIIDTLHTAMDGDENNAQDVKPFLEAIRALNRIGISVVVVHHLNKSGTIRGSVSIPAGADAVFTVKRDEQDPKLILLHCEKQKDFDMDDCPDMYFRMVQVSLETEFNTSLVLELDREKTKTEKRPIKLTPKFTEIWKFVNKHPGCTANQIQDGLGIGRNTWIRGRKQLMELGLLEERVSGHYWAVKQKDKK